VPQHFKRNYRKLWSQRNSLPDAYYRILAALQTTDMEIIGDSKALLQSISDGSVVSCSFAILHWTVQCVANCDANFCSNLLALLNNKMNSAAQDERLTQSDTVALISSIFLMGKTFRYIQNLNDYNFTGLQLMISETIPNNVKIPLEVRAVSTISLGKLCLWRRDSRCPSSQPSRSSCANRTSLGTPASNAIASSSCASYASGGQQPWTCM
jgi:hypothetical protein